MIQVLHLTPHLGGVGKALSRLAEPPEKNGVRHEFISLECPVKEQYVERIRDAGCNVHIAPTISFLHEMVSRSDILQLEWWNHPALFNAVVSLSSIPLRLIVWYHQSGLHYPFFQKGFNDVVDRLVLTSPCSIDACSPELTKTSRKRVVDVISSGCGCDELPLVQSLGQSLDGNRLSVGYVGSMNYSKLHPDFVSWVGGVDVDGFSVKMIGDEINRLDLEAKCSQIGKPNLLDFAGYTVDLASELGKLDILAYLLNPQHYGTAENALIEAMAMMVVPIVLDNPAEACIVENGVTGFIVSSPNEFRQVVLHLINDSKERNAVGARASIYARNKYTSVSMRNSFRSIYDSVVRNDKHRVDFESVLGRTPSDWFLSYQGESPIYGVDGSVEIEDGTIPAPSHYEHNKGSVFHFLRTNPYDIQLQSWAKALCNIRASI